MRAEPARGLGLKYAIAVDEYGEKDEDWLERTIKIWVKVLKRS